ncbi:MAG: diacylglycerol kinase family protein [Bacteroidetes bacterium]|jgi:diacylglycerol kinase|nr:diacylglycerol kinase family protein [Bacteroidota bacterium]MDF1863380.1 diacylglycerol kinase family protein [Saprospiraceae bacterium]
MWKKRINSFKFAFTGIATLFKSEPNAKIHLFCTIGVIFAGFYFSISKMEWALITVAISMVLAAEAFNTAIEFLTDLTSPGFHILAGKAKDVAAGGVLLTAFGAIIIGGIVFLPKLATLFQ